MAQSNNKQKKFRPFVMVVIIIGIAVVGLELWQSRDNIATSSPEKSTQVKLVRWHHDYSKAVAYAKDINKPILLDFYATWCGPCQRMEEQVYSHPASADYINAHFVPVQIDLTNGGPAPIARKLGVRALPTLAIQSPDGNKTIATQVGYRGKSSMMQWLKTNIKNPTAKTSEHVTSPETEPAIKTVS